MGTKSSQCLQFVSHPNPLALSPNPDQKNGPNPDQRKKHGMCVANKCLHFFFFNSKYAASKSNDTSSSNVDDEVPFSHWVSFLLESDRGKKIMQQWLDPYLSSCVMCDLE